jgi:hypothetical protein
MWNMETLFRQEYLKQLNNFLQKVSHLLGSLYDPDKAPIYHKRSLPCLFSSTLCVFTFYTVGKHLRKKFQANFYYAYLKDHKF